MRFLLGAALVEAALLMLVVVMSSLGWNSVDDVPKLLRPLARAGTRVRSAFVPRPTSEPLPLVLLSLELARLAEGVQRAAASNQPHQAARLAAAQAAYDQVLLEICRLVDLPTPTSLTPLHHSIRLEIESQLVSSGVEW